MGDTFLWQYQIYLSNGKAKKSVIQQQVPPILLWNYDGTCGWISNRDFSKVTFAIEQNQSL